MKEVKKFISPNAWFEFEYPANWFEFEDGEGSFLFYNPDAWDGNFRISGFKGESGNYGVEFVKEEVSYSSKLKSYPLDFGVAKYEVSKFTQDEQTFDTYRWVLGIADMGLDCSFITQEGESSKIAKQIIESIKVRDLSQKYPAEIIPIRLSEIYAINEAYENVTMLVKESFSKDFQGAEEDLASLDKIVGDELIPKKKRDRWVEVGLTLGVILSNEVEGIEWRSLIDGNREDAVLYYTPTQRVIDPMKLVWSKVKAGEALNITESYQEALASLHA